MTLKQFLEKNGIEATNYQRSKLGRMIKASHHKPRVKESNYLVVDYDELELMQNENISIIINFLNSQS